MLKTKVCIIGAGPAGIAASLFLSRSGIEHVMVDRDVFPRHKVCGECYDGRVTRILNEVDPELIPTMLKENIIQYTDHYTLLKSSGRVFEIISKMRNRVSRIQTERWYFDNFLLKYAQKSSHLQFFDNQTVVEIEKGSNEFTIKTRANALEISADFLLMACGSDSLLTQHFLNDIRPESPNRFIFERLYYQLKEPFPNNSVTIHYCVKPFAHAIVLCPTPGNKVNIELAVDKESFQRFKPDMSQMIRNFLAGNQLEKSIFQGAEEIYKPRGASMTLHNPAISFEGDRYLIIGDAAFCSNPLAGLGVGQAMTMGKIAALQVADCFKNGVFNKNYEVDFDRTIRKRFSKEIQQGKFITFMFKSPFLMNKLFAIVTFSPRFSRYLTKLLSLFF
ncbi:MAG: NAD(P)/FAD-dependent oxidoreductase [Saprospiraceae bacterium]